MWIVKPAAKSRGRGIMTFNDLPKLLKYIDAGAGGSTLWIVQKYMENALIVAKRKFDLRQWVLVTDWNPLTVYFYDECYARFSVEEYNNQDSSMDNAFIHLVNNSIGKNSENFGKAATAEDGQEIEGFMWSCEMLSNYLKSMHGADYMNEKIRPRMKEIAKWSLMCASEMIEHRKNSWELYGFDFMVDDDFNAWLIEINSSPACDYSTKVTERYVQKALVEILQVVLDGREWEAAPRKTRGERPSTGGWDCIYKGQLLETPVSSFGADMSLKGEGIKPPKKNFPVQPLAAGEGSTGAYRLSEDSSSANLPSSPTSAAPNYRMGIQSGMEGLTVSGENALSCKSSAGVVPGTSGVARTSAPKTAQSVVSQSRSSTTGNSVNSSAIIGADKGAVPPVATKLSQPKSVSAKQVKFVPSSGTDTTPGVLPIALSTPSDEVAGGLGGGQLPQMSNLSDSISLDDSEDERLNCDDPDLNSAEYRDSGKLSVRSFGPHPFHTTNESANIPTTSALPASKKTTSAVSVKANPAKAAPVPIKLFTVDF